MMELLDSQKGFLLAAILLVGILVISGIKLITLKSAILKEAPAWEDVVRAVMAFSLLAAYIIGFVMVVNAVIHDVEHLESIEGYIALLGVVGVIVREIVAKLFD